MNFTEYVDAFNAGDDNGLVDRFFTEDFVYEGGARSIEGREAWRGFLHFAHNGVREIFRPITTFDGPNGHFCEIDMDFHAYAPRPDFPFGPLAPGDTYTVKFFVIYEQRGDRFSRLKAATWPVGQGTTTLPRLGAHVTQRAGFQALQGALSHEDGANAAQFFTDDVTVSSDGAARRVAIREAIDVLRAAGLATATLSDASDGALQATGDRAVTLGLNDGRIAAITLE